VTSEFDVVPGAVAPEKHGIGKDTHNDECSDLEPVRAAESWAYEHFPTWRSGGARKT
jgi:hypothetical protein